MNRYNAFSHGDLDEDIYIYIYMRPKGYIPLEGVALPPYPVCCLRKSLYGLK